ncbi:hypothetical protein ACHQM5_012750 [Ranunculus cassubicifolius]
MVGQNGIKLALNLISTHFGNLVSKVCESLLRRGTLTLPEIARFTQLPPLSVFMFCLAKQIKVISLRGYWPGKLWWEFREN